MTRTNNQWQESMVDLANGGVNVTANNTSVGTDGSAGPSTSTQIGGQDGSGILQPLQVDGSKNLKVNVATGSVTATNPSVGLDSAAVPGSETLIGAKDGSGNLKPVQTDGTNVLVKDANSAAMKTDLDTLAGIVSGSKGAIKAASGDFADGSIAAIGTTTQTKATDGSATSWSVIQLLKGIIDKLLSTLAVTQSGTWTVQPGNTANTTAWKVDNSAVTQPSNLTQLNSAAISLTNEIPVANVSNGETSITSPADGAALTASADNLITFSSAVNRIRIQNEHATVNVYWRTDAVSSTAYNKIAPNGSVVEWVDVHCTVLHLYVDGAINFNASGGAKVRGYA